MAESFAQRSLVAVAAMFAVCLTVNTVGAQHHTGAFDYHNTIQSGGGGGGGGGHVSSGFFRWMPHQIMIPRPSFGVRRVPLPFPYPVFRHHQVPLYRAQDVPMSKHHAMRTKTPKYVPVHKVIEVPQFIEVPVEVPIYQEVIVQKPIEVPIPFYITQKHTPPTRHVHPLTPHLDVSSLPTSPAQLPTLLHHVPVVAEDHGKEGVVEVVEAPAANDSTVAAPAGGGGGGDGSGGHDVSDANAEAAAAAAAHEDSNTSSGSGGSDADSVTVGVTAKTPTNSETELTDQLTPAATSVAAATVAANRRMFLAHHLFPMEHFW